MRRQAASRRRLDQEHRLLQHLGRQQVRARLDRLGAVEQPPGPGHLDLQGVRWQARGAAAASSVRAASRSKRIIGRALRLRLVHVVVVLITPRLKHAPERRQALFLRLLVRQAVHPLDLRHGHHGPRALGRIDARGRLHRLQHAEMRGGEPQEFPVLQELADVFVAQQAPHGGQLKLDEALEEGLGLLTDR